ncbi:MAG: GNAT family N-acetyltransferase [Flavobacteriaceae bacterium]|nr:GNAT family N-acetyltransferase [Flavobacteriaceae bacterium]
MIFETKRLLIRKLKTTDIVPFHEMNSNENVMIYTDSTVKTYDEDVLDLKNLIGNYKQPNNRFWVWAIIRKSDNLFLGSVAIIDYAKGKDEVGFRFLEKYWHNGYGFEVLKGLLVYAKKQDYKELYAEVYAKNIASEIVLKKAGFLFVKEKLCKKRKLIDRLFILKF